MALWLDFGATGLQNTLHPIYYHHHRFVRQILYLYYQKPKSMNCKAALNSVLDLQ